jgi:hypothetical protein
MEHDLWQGQQRFLSSRESLLKFGRNQISIYYRDKRQSGRCMYLQYKYHMCHILYEIYIRYKKCMISKIPSLISATFLVSVMRLELKLIC